VYDEARRPLYFRYYDPRVLRVYLPTCNEADLGAIFGPVACYFTEGEEGDTMVAYFTSESKLVQSTFRLSDAGRSR